MTCRCGAAKEHWAAFCAECFARLPQDAIDAINGRKPGAFARAALWLAEREREQEAKRERLTAVN